MTRVVNHNQNKHDPNPALTGNNGVAVHGGETVGGTTMERTRTKITAATRPLLTTTLGKEGGARTELEGREKS